MEVFELTGCTIKGIYSCVPSRSEDNLARCREIYNDEKKAASVVKATGINFRRVIDQNNSSLDLCVMAAEKLLADVGVDKQEIGAVVNVTFTPERIMPCNACQAQHRLGLSTDVAAFDINLACSGWVYGLYVASMMARSMRKHVLFLDGDAQTKYIDQSDLATVPVLADAGAATLIAPSAGDDVDSWRFAFMTKGEGGDALQLPFGGTLTMDGLAVFKFVTMDVLNMIHDFMIQIDETPSTIDAFVPHQANMYMIRQVAKKLGFPREKLLVSGDVLGNSSSATIPTTIAYCRDRLLAAGNARKVLISGFGGGLSAATGIVSIDNKCRLKVFDYDCGEMKGLK